MQIVQYVFALIVTLGVLVTVHELGHFLVARWSGAKVVRFSIGFGPSLLSRFDRRGTEFVVAAIPIGGYVKILDEREGRSRAARSRQDLQPFVADLADRVRARRTGRELPACYRDLLGAVRRRQHRRGSDHRRAFPRNTGVRGRSARR